MTKISIIEGKIDGLKAAITEVEELITSTDQEYRIKENSNAVPEDADAFTRYNLKTGSVDVLLKYGSKNSLKELAHELKHASQFQRKTLSFGEGGNFGGALHDLQDEREAFERGNLYGANRDIEFELKRPSYADIANKKTQRTYFSQSNNLNNPNETWGQRMEYLNQFSRDNNEPIRHYFRGWGYLIK